MKKNWLLIITGCISLSLVSYVYAANTDLTSGFPGRFISYGDKCLDVNGPDLYKNGGKVQIWDCNEAPNQKWRLDISNRLINGGGKCLEVKVGAGAEGGVVQVWDCHNKNTQKWNYRNGSLVNAAYGKCLDIAATDRIFNGDNVETRQCERTRAHQIWKFGRMQAAEMMAGRLVSFCGGRCLDVNGPDLNKDRGKVQLWDCNNAPNQQWRLLDDGKLINGGGKCLDVDSTQVNTNGGKVAIWACHDGANQKWRFEDGRLVSGHNKCLDISSGSRNRNDIKLQVWDCHEGINQKWEFQ